MMRTQINMWDSGNKRRTRSIRVRGAWDLELLSDFYQLAQVPHSG